MPDARPTRPYWTRVREAVSQLIAAILGFPCPDYGLSYYAGEAQAHGRWWGLIAAPLINLMFWDKNHCLNAFTNRI